MNIKDLKIGDLVKLKNDLKNGENYGTCDYYNDMKYKGFKKITCVIKDIEAFNIENNNINRVGYYYTPEMIAEVRRPIEYKIIYKCEESILDEEEKKYLSAVIKPFKDKIDSISKTRQAPGDYIQIYFYNNDCITFPYFEKDTMYKGMELNKNYTIEELGL